MLSVISDRIYGDIKAEAVASGARSLDQESTKRKLRVRDTVESGDEYRMATISELSVFDKNVQEAVTLAELMLRNLPAEYNVVALLAPKKLAKISYELASPETT